MKVLHLISNHKLTGPVDPAIRLASGLARIGVDSGVAVGRPELGAGPIDDLVRARGLEPLTDLRLSKHRRVLADRRDARVLAERLARSPVDVIHAHLDNAHRLALRVRRRAVAAGGAAPLVVRTLYDSEAPAASRDARRLFRTGSDGVFCFGDGVRAALLDRFGLAPGRVRRIEGAVVPDIFHPRPFEDTLRERFELPRTAVVVGIVARVQPHRRYEVLLEAFRRVSLDVPELHLLVLGRGTKAREIAHAGVERLGLGERVRLPGYVGGDDYARALACFDFKIFLVPGSDGTCRAVREAMATGAPPIVSRLGLLPEMVRDGVDGLVVDGDVDSLAGAIRRLATDEPFRRALASAAIERARTDFSQERQAGLVLDAYRQWQPRA